MCEGASQQSPELKNSTAPGPLPDSEVPGPATEKL